MKKTRNTVFIGFFGVFARILKKTGRFFVIKLILDDDFSLPFKIDMSWCEPPNDAIEPMPFLFHAFRIILKNVEMDTFVNVPCFVETIFDHPISFPYYRKSGDF